MKKGVFTFTTYGSGPTVWLAFHGVGQDRHSLAPLAETLAQTHTIYCLDLPYHGEQRAAAWPPVITSSHWQRLLTDFLAAQRIGRFSVLGFSIGGRFALLTAELFAARLDHVYLLAPDGVTEDRWFRLATSTALGRRGLRWLLNRTPVLLNLGSWLVRAGLLNEARLRFVTAVVQSPEQREQIYRAWTGFRRLCPNVPLFAQLMTHHNVTVRLFLAQYDAVFPRSATRPLERALPRCPVVVLKTGHASLIRRVAAYLQTESVA